MTTMLTENITYEYFFFFFKSRNQLSKHWLYKKDIHHYARIVIVNRLPGFTKGEIGGGGGGGSSRRAARFTILRYPTLYMIRRIHIVECASVGTKSMYLDVRFYTRRRGGTKNAAVFCFLPLPRESMLPSVRRGKTTTRFRFPYRLFNVQGWLCRMCIGVLSSRQKGGE